MSTQATVKGVGPLQRGSTSRSIVAYSFTVRTESIKELPATMSQVRFPAPIRALHKTISTTTFIQSKTSTSTSPRHGLIGLLLDPRSRFGKGTLLTRVANVALASGCEK